MCETVTSETERSTVHFVSLKHEVSGY